MVRKCCFTCEWGEESQYDDRDIACSMMGDRFPKLYGSDCPEYKAKSQYIANPINDEDIEFAGGTMERGLHIDNLAIFEKLKVIENDIEVIRKEIVNLAQKSSTEHSQ